MVHNFQPNWRPSAQRMIDPGSTDLKAAKDPAERLNDFKDSSCKKPTTSERAAQLVTNHWRRAEHDKRDTSFPTPDINRSKEYADNRYRAYHDSVAIGQATWRQASQTSGKANLSAKNDYLCDEFEQRRTRGISGYTGKQPLPHQRRPAKVEDAEDPSKLYGRGGSVERKPWSKGIPGYTGHQPIQDYLHAGRDVERHGVYMSMDATSKQNQEYNLTPARDYDDETMSSPVSNHSQSSQRVFKNNLVESNAPEDIARRKIEEALQYGDPLVEHEGSVATLRMSMKYHKAPPREDTQCPKQPVDCPRTGPMAEGLGAWKAFKGEQMPAESPECDFDWFMSQPKPVDKRISDFKDSAHWRNMSDLIVHKGPHAGIPHAPYQDGGFRRGRMVAYGGVKNAVPTRLGQQP